MKKKIKKKFQPATIVRCLNMFDHKSFYIALYIDIVLHCSWKNAYECTK